MAVDNASVKATPAIGGQTVATLPNETVLDAEAKQGEWYKVQVPREGGLISGYIHELLVVEISDAEAQQALGQSGRIRAQADIIVEIDRRIDENKRLVRQEAEFDRVIEDLSPMIAKAFAIDDRQEQKRIAGDLFFWIGQACAKKGDLYGALKNFRAMFDVDQIVAKALTNNVAEPAIMRLVDQAERIHKGLLTDYSLQVSTTPKEAELKINGKPVGLTPYIVRSPIPQLSLSIEKPGFRPIREEIFLTESTTSKEYALTSVGRNVAVRSSPPGARVSVDGRDTGARTNCELPFVPFGTRAIRLVLDNYAPQEATVDVLEGEGVKAEDLPDPSDRRHVAEPDHLDPAEPLALDEAAERLHVRDLSGFEPCGRVTRQEDPDRPLLAAGGGQRAGRRAGNVEVLQHVEWHRRLRRPGALRPTRL